MRKSMILVLGMMVVSFVLTMGSCEILGSLFNKPPTVSLAFTLGDANVYSDETVYLTATMSDPDGDPLTFTWYLDGVSQSVSTDQIYYTAPSAASDTTKVLSIRVSDGSETATDSITFNITASSTLYVYNNAYYSVYSLYVVPDSTMTWGTDLFGSSYMLPIGSTYKCYGMAQGNWDIRYNFYASGSPTAYTYKYDELFYNGSPRTLSVLAGGSWTSSYVPGPSGSISSTAGPRQIRFE